MSPRPVQPGATLREDALSIRDYALVSMERTKTATDFTITVASPTDFPLCLAIRRRVFVEEQSFPAEREMDQHDPIATHWIGQSPTGPMATARARVVEPFAKAERVAVLAAFRQRGVGRRLMEAIEEWARDQGLEGVQLNAQVDALPFYRKLGYRQQGPIFDEAGHPHQSMVKTFDLGKVSE